MTHAVKLVLYWRLQKAREALKSIASVLGITAALVEAKGQTRKLYSSKTVIYVNEQMYVGEGEVKTEWDSRIWQ